MEVDFSELNSGEQKLPQGVLIGIGVIVVLILLGLLGRFILSDGKVLTWSEWTIYKQHSEYRRDVRVLTRNADYLAEIVTDVPDPVRAQLALEKVDRDMEDISLVSLNAQKEALIGAAQGIVQWSLGQITRDDAVRVLNTANESVQAAVLRVNPEGEGQ
jgi:hypothetical protein